MFTRAASILNPLIKRCYTHMASEQERRRIMWAWIIGAVSIGLWVFAGRRAWDVMMRTGRSIESGKIAQQVKEMYGSEADIQHRMHAEPHEPAPAIKYAMMAGDNWAELKLRATDVTMRFPSKLQGGALLARALWELGEKDESRKVTRRVLHRYPGDVPLRLFATTQALDAGNLRGALRLTRAVRRDHPQDAWAYVIEATMLIAQKKYLEAEDVLNQADTHVPYNEHINKLWASLEEAVKA